MNTHASHLDISEIRSRTLFDKRTQNGTDNPCLLCGKEIKYDQDNTQYVTVGCYGMCIVPDSETDTDGCYPVGNDCYKKYVRGKV